jgi:acetylglutamate/LysW-gamma-L-alpha-aminoadipate kinase
MAVDGGYTGKIHSVDPSLINVLLDQGYTPVISPVAISEEFDFLNVDGDRAAAYIAGGLKAQIVVFITNVAGLILQDKLVTDITLEQANSSLSKIGYGMEKKIIASKEAIEMGVNESVIASGKVEYPISAAIAHNNCTVITAS